MINPFKDINWSPDNAELRKFGKTMLIGLPIVGILFFLALWQIKGMEMPAAIEVGASIAIAGVVICITSLIAPPLAKAFYMVWFLFAACMGIVMGNLVMIVIYYLLFSVFAVVFRKITGRDPLRLKKDKSAESYWVGITKTKSVKSYFNQY